MLFLQAEVLAQIEKVCDYLGLLSGTCKSILDEYFPMIWKLMDEEIVSVVCL